MTNRDGKTASPLLRLENLEVRVSVSGRTIRAVDGVSFDLERGGALGIVGESGSGKTMLCRSIPGLLPQAATISEGSAILFGGKDLAKMTEKELASIRGKRIAMVLQDPMSSLNPAIRSGQQIAESQRFHLKLNRGDARQKSLELLRSVGIPDPERRMEQYPHQLSGGLRQRVAIAAALACDPELLIADEPTSALDTAVQAELLRLLLKLRRERNMATILVTHDLGVAAAVADQIAVMYGGRIVEHAPAKQLFAEARMPYTMALIAAVPRLDSAPRARLKAIGGEPPDPLRPAVGCAFSPRCPYAGQKCRKNAPPLESTNGDGHLFACWNPPQVRPRFWEKGGKI